LEVGYSYTWARPPIDVYTPLMEPLRNFDGADLQFSWEAGIPFTSLRAETEFQLFGGKMSGVFLDNDIEVTPATGFNIAAQFESLRLRYGFFGMRSSLKNNKLEAVLPLLEQAAAAAPSLAGVAARLGAEDQWYYYHGFGLIWEHHPWTVTAERYVVMSSGDQFANDARGWYLSLQRQFGPLTPYFVAGYYKNQLDQRIDQLLAASYTEFPAGLSPEIDQLRQIAGIAIEEMGVRETTWTIGIRWDVLPDVAVKLEQQRFRFMNDSTGHMLPIEGYGNSADRANLTTLVVDMVF
jgi:hypothetical protein